jgi:hypothetical protein
MSQEGQRWLGIIDDRMRARPVMTVLAVIVPVVGVLLGAITAVSTW